MTASDFSAPLNQSHILHFKQAGDLAFAQQDWSKAIRSYAELLRLQNPTPELYLKLSQSFARLGDLKASAELALQTLKLDPQFSSAYHQLGELSLAQGQQFQALNFFRQWADLAQDEASFLNTGWLAFDLGNTHEALNWFERALAQNPGSVEAVRRYLFMLMRDEHLDQQALTGRQQAVIEAYFAAQKIIPSENSLPKQRTQPQHLAYVSSLFSAHATSVYLLPLLEHHDRKRFKISCYNTGGTSPEDPIAQWFRNIPDLRFVEAQHLTAPELAAQMREDQVDILIEYSGFESQHDTLFVLLHQAAPLQLTYLGSISSYGFNGPHQMLSHPDLIVPGAQFPESAAYLQTYCTFKPQQHLPDLTSLPSLEGPFTFGIFNHPSKISASDWQCWSQILAACPDSRLFFCRNSWDWTILEDRLKNAKIAPERVQLQAFSLEQYQYCDLQLDTAHFNGMTISFDSLLMGVPVLTRRGRTQTGRMGAYLLGQLKLEEFIAQDAEEFIQMAVNWTQRRQELARIRTNLRQLVLASPFCDSATFTHNFENQLLKFWHELI